MTSCPDFSDNLLVPPDRVFLRVIAPALRVGVLAVSIMSATAHQGMAAQPDNTTADAIPFAKASLIAPDAPNGDNPEIQPPLGIAGLAAKSMDGGKGKAPAVMSMKLVGVLDREVVGPEKEQVGHVIDVLLDPYARPTALVVDTGGFMGVGNRKIAISWGMIVPESLATSDSLQVRMNADAIRAAPAYDPGTPEVVVVQPPPATEKSTAGQQPAPVASIKAVAHQDDTAVKATETQPAMDANGGSGVTNQHADQPDATGGATESKQNAAPPNRGTENTHPEPQDGDLHHRFIRSPGPSLMSEKKDMR